MLLLLTTVVLELESHRAETLNIFAKTIAGKKKDEVLRAPTRVGRRNSTRFDAGRKS